MIVTQPQVEQALRRPLTESELEALEHLVREAQVLLSAYLKTDYAVATVPMAVTVVATRMVARALNVNPDTIGVASEQAGTGPYQYSRSYIPETRTGNVIYLSKTDKEMLGGLKPSGIGSVRLKSGRS